MELSDNDSQSSWARRILSFVLGQGAIQAFSLVTGFLILRWMSVESYAQYSVAFGFQTSIGILIDLGLSGAVVALVGQRVSDPEVVGSYIRSVLRYRTILFVIALPAGAVAFVWMTQRHGWSWPVRGALFASIMFALFFQGWSSYGSALVIRHRFGQYYRSQLSSASFRLASTALLHALSLLSAVSTAWVNAIAMALVGACYRLSARPIVREPPRANPAISREMLRYVGPTVPPTIFNALEGQITLFLVTCFGRSHNIAEVAALGRLMQIVFVLLMFNGVIVVPYFARLPRRRLAGQYVLFLSLGILIATSFWGLSVFAPQPLLWVMGPKYAHLREELPWSVAGFSAYYVGQLLWSMHSARKWVFWWHTSLYCGALISAQIVGVWIFPLGTTIGILHFAFLGAAANLLVQATCGVYGFLTDRRAPDPGGDAWAEESILPGAVPAACENPRL
jgi:O-antigen/teichoic acid export membrane protein